VNKEFKTLFINGGITTPFTKDEEDVWEWWEYERQERREYARIGPEYVKIRCARGCDWDKCPLNRSRH
jgi:hypothetical protein